MGCVTVHQRNCCTYSECHGWIIVSSYVIYIFQEIYYTIWTSADYSPPSSAKYLYPGSNFTCCDDICAKSCASGIQRMRGSQHLFIQRLIKVHVISLLFGCCGGYMKEMSLYVGRWLLRCQTLYCMFLKLMRWCRRKLLQNTEPLHKIIYKMLSIY